QLDREDGPEVAVVEIGDELADDEKQKQQTSQIGKSLRDGVDGVLDRAKRLRAEAVGQSGRQKYDHDEEDQTVHERRVADEGLGIAVASRRTGRYGQQGKHNDDADQSEQGEQQAA